jgi:hypothetical protein
VYVDTPLESIAMAVIDARERAIDACRAHLDTGPAIGGRWSAVLEHSDAHEVRSTVIPDVVDETILAVLGTIDAGELVLFAHDPNANAFTSVRELGDSNLAGGYVDDDEGWRTVYSHRPAYPFGQRASKTTDALRDLGVAMADAASPGTSPDAPVTGRHERLAEPPPEGPRGSCGSNTPPD